MKRAALLLLTLSLLTPAAKAGNCTFTVPNPPTHDFGTYLPLSGGAVQQLTTFNVDCVPPETVTVQFSAGGSGNLAARQMSFGVNTLSYNIYRDAGRSEVWGNGTSGTFTLSKTMTTGDRTLVVNVYGQIPAGLNAVPSSPSLYTDQITVTIIWSGGSKSDTRTFQVQAKVDPECSVTTAPLAFGNYDPVSANAVTALNGVGTVNVYCTTGTFATVMLDPGSHAAGTTRRMLGPSANLLTYEIYLDSTRATPWRTASPNVLTGTSSSKNIAINNGFTAYGQIPAGQDVVFGSYTDTVLVTVNY